MVEIVSIPAEATGTDCTPEKYAAIRIVLSDPRMVLTNNASAQTPQVWATIHQE